MKYYANMYVNNGTRFSKDLEGTNYRKLAKQISRSARANCFVQNEYKWEVWDEENNIVAAGSGRKTPNGFVAYYTPIQ